MIDRAAALFAWYERHGRAHLPWRRTRDPYLIVVSEFMLQQTQVDRVLPLYTAFVARFPTLAALARADGGDVLRAWRGLGYNSRALRLRDLARAVVDQHGGVLPVERDALLALPGIGPYTAAALRAFAFDRDDAALDTNIRRIVHRVVLGLEYPPQAGPRALDALATASVPAGRGHDWNSAMMDLGATICTARAPKCFLCPLRDGCAAAPVDAVALARLARPASRSPQAGLPFEETVRFLRGRIIDRLRDTPAGAALTLEQLKTDLAPVVRAERLDEVEGVVGALCGDGLCVRTERGIALRA